MKKQILFLQFIVFTLFINCNSIYKIENNETIFYTARIANVEIYEQPNKQSKVIDKLDYCDLIESKEKHVVNNICFYKIKAKENIIGYVQCLNLEKYINYKETDDLPFDIIGKWPMHYDDPNYYFVFLNENKFNFIFSDDFNGIHKITNGTYIYDGFKNITILFDDGQEFHLEVIILNNVKTLKFKCFLFDEKLYKPLK